MYLKKKQQSRLSKLLKKHVNSGIVPMTIYSMFCQTTKRREKEEHKKIKHSARNDKIITYK